MENQALVSSPKMVLGFLANPKDMVSSRYPFGLPFLFRSKTTRIGLNRSTTSISALSRHLDNRARGPLRLPKTNVLEKLGRECFASVTSSGSQETSSVGVNPQLAVPPPPSHFGSPLFWVGVGVGLSALFSLVATNLKKFAMQQAFKTLMGQMDSQNNQFNNAAFSPGSPFPFPTPSASGPAASPPFPTAPPSRPATSPLPATYQSAVTIDTTATVTKVEAPPATDVKDNTEPKQPKKYAFVDVSSEETLQRSPFTEFEETDQSDSSKDAEFADKVSQNGVSSRPGVGAASEWSSSAGKTSSVLSVEALEKMMEDPTVQKMVYPYLPEEMRNPTTFKWMLQNPQYRQQLEEMLNNMGGSTEWDNRMMDSLKNFDLSSPDVKQQFDQIGLTPEEVISKIMANPDVAMAFQNPRVQAAIMDCSQNPLSIAKYQNDKEVMDVFNKISELFPGMTGS
ncbi:Protein TIC 40 like [Actinidia chinensis var. chinensis]|uniref:Protein TIC 40, chloroplastic n=1 Tax=Actinidia chinensis var. chinensis TaxID=1590841 RepID=A0A2R6RP55_ACTCC|nr:Protein TIC 40 like [Actinidia chinensis var. chinensis]